MCPELTLKVSKFIRITGSTEASALGPCKLFQGPLLSYSSTLVCPLPTSNVPALPQGRQDRGRETSGPLAKALGYWVRTHEIPPHFILVRPGLVAYPL